MVRRRRVRAYQLEFIDTAEQVTRVLDIEAAGDDAATALCWGHASRSRMTVELWDKARLVTRSTPIVARLYVNDDQAA
jgi:hypothetical protein